MVLKTCMKMLFARSILLAVLVATASAFNLLLIEQMVTFVTSDVMQQLGFLSATGQYQLPSNVEPSYFGYSFSLIKQSEEEARMIIGSPKAIDPMNPPLQKGDVFRGSEPRGNIQSCSISGQTFLGSATECIPAYPPNPVPGDNFGLHVSARADGHVRACSPTRDQDCEEHKFNPGICYKSDDTGNMWEEDGNTKKLSCPVTDVEVLFVLDGSGSVGRENFGTVKNWVKGIAKKIDLDAGKVTVGVVQYSHYDSDYALDEQPWIVTHIRIGQYVTYSAFANAVDKIKLQGYTTYTGKALRKVVMDFQNTKNYNKKTTKQVMILLTDGKANDGDVIPANAKYLRDMGVVPYAVGVTESVNIRELKLIANGHTNDSTRVYAAANFSDLDAIAKDLEAEIQNIALEGGDFELQFGQVGLSETFSKRKPKRLRRDVSVDFGVSRWLRGLMWFRMSVQLCLGEYVRHLCVGSACLLLRLA